MKEKIKELEKICESENPEAQEIFKSILGSLTNRVDKYIGDYPTFIEPVYLGDNVKIGDDVLLGPNVYVGKNVEIKDYVEISNSIIFDNCIISENIKLNNCIVGKNSSLNCKNIPIDKNEFNLSLLSELLEESSCTKLEELQKILLDLYKKVELQRKKNQQLIRKSSGFLVPRKVMNSQKVIPAEHQVKDSFNQRKSYFESLSRKATAN